MTPEQRKLLEVKLLRGLMKRDARIWRSRSTGQDARIEDEPLESGMAKLIGEMKRVRTARRAAVKA